MFKRNFNSSYKGTKTYNNVPNLKNVNCQLSAVVNIFNNIFHMNKIKQKLFYT